MGIGKQGSPRRQFIQIGRFDLRMATQASDPIIQIINGKKQNVGLGRSFGQWPKNKEECKKG
jgi:hypothetical protein